MSVRTSFAVAVLAAVLAVSTPARADQKAAEAPIPAPILSLMTAKDTTPSAPVLIRVYKKESELEVWKKARSGRFVLLKTYPICRWSGQLGPKRRQGDRQAPEGFYTVSPRQMNPNSAYYLSFDTGFPNAYDKAQGATGSALMVHGTCSSMGCYAMTDQQIGEIYAIAREAFAGGQQAFQFQAFPFRMTAENLARHRTGPNYAFWRQLKEGSDRFEATGEEPAVSVLAGRYAFLPSKDPKREAVAKARVEAENGRIADLAAQGAAIVKTVFTDGGQHPSFRLIAQQNPASLGMVSRPEALAYAGREVVVVPARKKPLSEIIAMLPPPRPSFDEAAPKEPQEIRLPAPLVETTTLADLVVPAPTPAAVSLSSPLPGSVRVLSASLDPGQLRTGTVR
jgi:murein L,D-transpeptidase YafK